MQSTELTIANETLHLLPEHARQWPRAQTLFIADPHFGKAATFCAYAIPVPGGATAAERRRLAQAIDRAGARRLIIRGDLLPAAKGRDTAVLAAVTRQRVQYPDLDILHVRGNHDRHAGGPPAAWRMEVVDGPIRGPHGVLNHEPVAPETGNALVGHLHPAVQLTGKGCQALKLPCFWFGKQCGVLPAFSAFVDHGTIHPRQGERVFVVAEQQVLPV